MKKAIVGIIIVILGILLGVFGAARNLFGVDYRNSAGILALILIFFGLYIAIGRLNKWIGE